MSHEIAKIGKRGTMVIPATLRRLFDLHEGDTMIAEDHGDGILLRPAVMVPIEKYSKKRKAGFLLSNAISKIDYQNACKQVKALGLDPKKIKHIPPQH
jgi:AbrB family looped-hinge helix DNA binding protein